MIRKFILSILLLISSLYLSAQQEEMSSDRPTKSNTSIINDNTAQFETGILIDNGQSLLYFTTIKYGFNKWVELRLDVPVRSSNKFNNFTYKPLSIGTKLKLSNQGKRCSPFDVALQFSVDLNTDSAFYSSYTAFVIINRDFENFSLLSNLGYREWTGNLFYTLVAIKRLDRFGIFLEVYGDIDGEHLFDGGGTYLITPDFQVDISAGKSFENNNYLLSAGFTYRVNN